jgi:D-alanyl-lipoteichoic acid acyltransferase DltB (MBOAT superfamily)
VNFVSFEFLGFLGAVYVFHWVLPQGRARKWLLTVASYLFYAAWDWRFCFLMLFVTVNAFAAGHLLLSFERSGRKLTLAASIGVDLAVLAFFKYYNFFAANAAVALADLGFPGNLPILQIVLPVGISFYTFHAISYVVDIYRGRVQPETSFVNVALYIGFFPQLIAGPIVRATFIMPQIRRRRPFSRSQQAMGIRLLLRGFIYKAVIADMLGQVADPVFAHLDQYDPHALLTAVVAFYGQIYFDFAGYSSMAIGTARLFGYRLPRNFDYPYSSASVTEFWRRWHMSLSFWLRDYVYIPLGGNRGGRLAVYRNLMTTMLLGGLWHGAAWNYVIWGLLHGFGLCVNKAWVTVRPGLPVAVNWQSGSWRTVAIVLTQLWIMVAWVFFRCDSVAEANRVLGSIVGLHPHPGAAIVPLEPWIVLIIAIDHTLGSGALRWSIPRGWAQALSWGGIGMLLALALATMPLVQRPFIYFQF